MTRLERQIEQAQSAHGPTLSVLAVALVVAEAYGVTFNQLRAKSRRSEYTRPRQAAMYLADRYTDATRTEIGRVFNRHHPSVRNAIRRIESVRLKEGN